MIKKLVRFPDFRDIVMDELGFRLDLLSAFNKIRWCGREDK